MKYVILRDPERPVTRGGGRPIFRGLAQESPVIPKVEVEDLNARERRDLARDPDVRERIAALMPTRLIEPLSSSADNEPGDAWGIAAVGADVSTFTGAGIRVAVLDTGIDRTHPAFADLTVIDEEDFSGHGKGDKNGHGTHCAGTIFGRDVDGSRIGVARGVSHALIGKVLGDKGEGDTEGISRGITWALEKGARVISVSLGLDFPRIMNEYIAEGRPQGAALSLTLDAYRENFLLFDRLMGTVQARDAVGSAGCLVVAAAGNESRRNLKPEDRYEVSTSLPAAANGILSTGALERSANGYIVAPYSNTSPKLSAPGTGIKSAYPGGGLATSKGTSMAGPHVAGVAALWWEKILAMPVPPIAETVVTRLLAHCRYDVFAPGMHQDLYGQGLVTAPLADPAPAPPGG